MHQEPTVINMMNAISKAWGPAVSDHMGTSYNGADANSVGQVGPSILHF